MIRSFPAAAAAAAALVLVWGGLSDAETLNNTSVIEMVRAGLGPDTIVAKIHTAAASFDLSTDQLIALKRAGVPDPVIAAMLNAGADSQVSTKAAGDSTSPDPKMPHAPGIYLLDASGSSAHMVHIDATRSNETKTSGILAYAFSYGIAKVKVKTVLPNPSARVRSYTHQPVFYFYFDQPNASLSGNQYVGAWLPGAVTSPNEFSLVRFEVTEGTRQAVLGQFNITGLQTGVMDKARVAFTYDPVTTGVFRVAPSEGLPAGEYAFVYSTGTTGGAMGVGQTAKIFDFAVASDGEVLAGGSPTTSRTPDPVAAPANPRAPAAVGSQSAPTAQAAPPRRPHCAISSPTNPEAVTC